MERIGSRQASRRYCCPSLMLNTVVDDAELDDQAVLVALPESDVHLVSLFAHARGRAAAVVGYGLLMATARIGRKRT